MNLLLKCLSQAYEHEMLTTAHSNELAITAREAGDCSTFNFLQWSVAEQP